MLNRATLVDIDSITNIHMDSITGSVSVLMGRQFVRKLYKGLLNDPYSTIMTYKQGNELAGFISYTTHYNKTNQIIKAKLNPIDKIIFLFKVVTHFRTLILFTQQSLFHFLFPRHREHDYLFVLTLAVKREYRKHGVGTKLIQYIQTKANHDHSPIFLDTVAQNQKAISFYQKSDFHPVISAFSNIGFLFQP